MIRRVLPLAAILTVGACAGAAIVGPANDDTTDDTSASTLEGTKTAAGYVQRYEGTEAEGYARGIVYDADSDTLQVDNLPFDGTNVPYTRSASVPNIGGTGALSAGPFKVYEAAGTVPDAATGDPIGQFTYRAIHGESTNTVNGKPRTSFTIVRTGSYSGYGFGGFVFERNGSVAIPKPTAGSPAGEATQGVYTGDYAGLVDFDGAGGMTYVQGDAEVTIDFQDFNDQTKMGDAVRADITGRRYYSLTGADVTSAYLDQLNDDLGYDVAAGEGLTSVPVLRFRIAAGGVTDKTGEMEGEAYAVAPDSTGGAVEYQAGKYYAVLAGDSTATATGTTNEIVGIVVVEGDFGDAIMRETGGFIVYRGLGH